MRIGVYPGTFDPVTLGHIDIAGRAIKVVDKLYIVVAESSNKDTLLSVTERVSLIKKEIYNNKNLKNFPIIVASFKGLLVNYAKDINASIIIRGIRAVSDFEYEFQMSCMNSKLEHNIQTIFLPASEKMQLVSSKLVKEVIRLGGDAEDFVSREVFNYLKERIAK